MSLSQTKKAINERKRRINDREKRRHNVFIDDYIATKYKAIYLECNTFYDQLRGMYPNKLNVTKTYRYRKWKKQIAETAETITNTEAPDPESVPDEVEIESTEAPDPESVPDEVEIESTEAPDPESVPDEVEIESTEAASILEVATQGLIPPEVLTLDDMDRIVNDIIQELEHDNEILNLLPAIEETELDELLW